MAAQLGTNLPGLSPRFSVNLNALSQKTGLFAKAQSHLKVTSI